VQTSARNRQHAKLPKSLCAARDRAVLVEVIAPFAVLVDGRRDAREVAATTRTRAAALAFARGSPELRPTVYALDPHPPRPAWRWHRVALWSPTAASRKSKVDQHVVNSSKKFRAVEEE